jgi:2-polyprenyl-3-methyl-5-hydroxy-6-metoxy-1,4-benzoquinol methylase
MARTREPQYERCLEVSERSGRTTLGLMSNQVWHDDPRRLAFVLARYKFVSKMLSGMSRVLEVGCADAFATRIVAQEVDHITAVDFDSVFIDDVKVRMDPRWPIDARVHDMLQGPVDGVFDAAYAVDVLEHINADKEDTFLENIVASLTEAGVLLVGIPSIQSQAYASPPSRAGHVNCKDAPGLRATMHRHFRNVFIFSMNDEVVHTGFYPMAHYLFALGCGPARKATPRLTP